MQYKVADLLCGRALCVYQQQKSCRVSSYQITLSNPNCHLGGGMLSFSYICTTLWPLHNESWNIKQEAVCQVDYYYCTIYTCCSVEFPTVSCTKTVGGCKRIKETAGDSTLLSPIARDTSVHFFLFVLRC